MNPNGPLLLWLLSMLFGLVVGIPIGFFVKHSEAMGKMYRDGFADGCKACAVELEKTLGESRLKQFGNLIAAMKSVRGSQS